MRQIFSVSWELIGLYGNTPSDGDVVYDGRSILGI
jgi:hypothetical protein